MQTGHRKSEWCQDTSEFRKKNSISLNIKQTSSAFIVVDFILSHKSSSYETTSSSPSQCPNYLNYKHPHLSPVRAAERTLHVLIGSNNHHIFTSQSSLPLHPHPN